MFMWSVHVHVHECFQSGFAVVGACDRQCFMCCLVVLSRLKTSSCHPASDYCAWPSRWVSTWSRSWGDARVSPLPPSLLRWSQRAKLCCFGFCRAVRVHSHWTCRPSLRHPRASHPTPPQLPHRFPQLLPPPSWAPQAPWSTAPCPPASEDRPPELAQ